MLQSVSDGLMVARLLEVVKSQQHLPSSKSANTNGVSCVSRKAGNGNTFLFMHTLKHHTWTGNIFTRGDSPAPVYAPHELTSVHRVPLVEPINT